VEGALAPVVWQLKLEDEKTPLFSTYRPGVWPLPSDCHVGVSLHLLTFQKLVGDLVPGQPPCIDLFLWALAAALQLQALEPLCPVTMIHPLVESSMPFHWLGQDLGHLEGWTETLDVALRLCRVAAESSGR
jgi:hypothetical protein